MDNPYDSDVARFSVTFTRSIIAWNVAESAARSILMSFSKDGLGLIVATQHLGSIALRDALQTLADMTDDNERPASQEIAQHVKHFVDGMDVLRAYRNFYVHSLLSIGKSPYEVGVFQGRLHSIEARGRYSWVEQTVTVAELERFMVHTLELSEYGAGLSLNLGPGNALNPAPKPPLASLQKPLWPEKLKKHRNYLQERRPPPQS